MDVYTATEEAYKNGYNDGYKKGLEDGKKEASLKWMFRWWNRRRWMYRKRMRWDKCGKSKRKFILKSF